MHEANRELFLRAAKALGTDLVGFDLIAEDISKSYHEQNLVFLEANTLPYIDLHQFPSHGKPEQISKVIWDVALNEV